MLSRYTLLSTDLYPTCSRIGLGRQFYIKNKKKNINWMQLRNQNSHSKFQLKLTTYFHFLLVEACVSTFLSVIMDQTWFHFICLSACKFNTMSAFLFPHIFCNAFTNVALYIYIYIFSRSMIIFESFNYKNMFCL